jgi:hypothetical protein
MKRAKLATVLLSLIVAVAVVALAFGPMQQTHSQCLICNRTRVEKWVIGLKVRDQVVTNVHSNWIDTFTPSSHEHVWMGSSSQSREWFGSTMIGCGGIATISRIYEQRDRLGEIEARRLLAQYHDLVSNGPEWDALTKFGECLGPTSKNGKTD